MFKYLREKYIPSEPKIKWREYWVIFYPVLLGSMLFAFNGFIDNFMVGKYNAAGALAVANSWTNIVFGLLIGIAAAGGVVMVQFYHKGDFETAKQISKVRYILSLFVALPFATIGFIDPNILNKVYIKDWENNEAALQLLEYANDYMRIIIYQWILLAITFNAGITLREIGHGKATLYSGIGGLIINILLNSILMYWLNIGVHGAAYATLSSNIFALLFSIYYIKKHKIKIGFYPWQIFNIKIKAWKIVFKRWYMIIVVGSSILFITIRMLIYAQTYPTGSIGKGVGALDILGLTGAITNVFMATFNVLAIMSANFVAPFLSRNNFKEAKRNANQLKFFNTVMATILGILLFGLSFSFPYCDFLIDSNDSSKDTEKILLYVRNTSWIIAGFYPIWIWFMSSFRNALSGGHAKIFSLVDWIFTGPIQLSWLYGLGFIVDPNNFDFALFFLLFYLSDLIKWPLYEFVYAKSNWAKNITELEVYEENATATQLQNLDM